MNTAERTAEGGDGATKTDVLVIGTGFGAAAPALRLAKAGYRVTLLERGPTVGPASFRQTQDPEYLLRYYRTLTGDHLSLAFVEALGGGSGFYEMVSLRAPSLVFEQTDRRGARLWPPGLDRGALDRYYDVAERMLRVEQIPIERVPKTGLVFSRMMKNLGYSCELARYAVGACAESGRCVTGCTYGFKRSLFTNYLPRAERFGATVLTGMEALRIRPLNGGRSITDSGPLTDIPYRYEVYARETAGGRHPVRFRARLVIVAAGTVGSALLLLRSRDVLGRLGSHVGRNIGFDGGVQTAGLLSDQLPDGDMFTGRSHPGTVSYQFLQSHGVMLTAAKPLPLQLVASARLHPEGDDSEPWFWGTANVEIMKQVRRRMIVLAAFGLTPPSGQLTLVGDRPELSLELSDELRRYHRRTRELLESILRRNGCRVLQPQFLNRKGLPRGEIHFSTTHQTGSCRMAERPSRGVTDATGAVFGYPGLYVSDGATIPTSLAVNPSLTILANAERIAERILDRYSSGDGNLGR
jgi:choline dehydrogenase-like flavoprotein